MQVQPDTDSFIHFPYPPDGKENNGGFDLVKKPEDIDKITEFQKFPALRKYIEWLNFKTDKYRSFGCDGGWDGDTFAAYIEFSFRDSETAKKQELYREIFDSFERYIIQNHPPERAISILRSVFPRMAQIRESGHIFGYKIAFCILAQTPEAAEQLFDLFFDFLKEHNLP